MPFSAEVIGGDVAVIRGSGRLNMLTAPRLDMVLQSVIDRGVQKIVIDLTNIRFLDATGLGAIIRGLKAARALGGDLRLAATGAQPSLVLETSHVDGLLPSHQDPHQAFPSS